MLFGGAASETDAPIIRGVSVACFATEVEDHRLRKITRKSRRTGKRDASHILKLVEGRFPRL